MLCFTLDPYNLFFTHILKFSNMLAAFDKFYMHQIEIFFFSLDLFKSFVIFIPLKWRINCVVEHTSHKSSESKQ